MSPPILTAVSALPQPWFAAVDGAQIDGLRCLLEQHHLAAVPLFLEAADSAAVDAGPFLVELASIQSVEALIGLVAGRPAAVFWSWRNGGDSLRRHLRSLNLIEIPDQDRTDPNQPAYECVIFRHWDANVLAVTLPVLTEGQESRFFGDAQAIAFDASDFGGSRWTNRPPTLPPKPHGMLRFSEQQLASITATRMSASHARIASYLRSVASVPTADMTDLALFTAIRTYHNEALTLGLKSERDVGRWAYLQVMSGGRLKPDGIMRTAFTVPDAGRTPTECLDRLYQALAVLVRNPR